MHSNAQTSLEEYAKKKKKTPYATALQWPNNFRAMQKKNLTQKTLATAP